MKTIKCPYNPVHIMPENSLLNHLSRCTATNKHQFTKCKYNPVHVILKISIDDHYKICKDRVFDFDSDEDWDEIGNVQTKNNQSYYESSVSYSKEEQIKINNKKKYVEKKESSGLHSDSDSQSKSSKQKQEDEQNFKSFQSYTQKQSEENSSVSQLSIVTNSSTSKLSIKQNSIDKHELKVYEYQSSSYVQKQEKKDKTYKKKQKKSGDSQLQVSDF